MNKALRVGTAIVLALAVAGCGKALKEENAQLKEQMTQMTEMNNMLTTEKTSLETQVAEMTAKIAGLETEKTALSEQLAAKIRARPAPKKKG